MHFLFAITQHFILGRTDHAIRVVIACPKHGLHWRYNEPAMTGTMIEDRIPNILQSLPRRISDVVKPWAEGSPDRPALV